MSDPWNLLPDSVVSAPTLIPSKPVWTEPGPTTSTWTHQSGFKILSTHERAISQHGVKTLYEEDSSIN